MTTIVIQTALTLEREPILNRLLNVYDELHPESRTVYKIGEIQYIKGVKIVVGLTDQTNVNSAIETERIIQHFKPDYIFFVGVAGGLKDVKVGDIVIGADIFGYERGKVSDEILSRPQFAISSYELCQHALNYSLSEAWKTKVGNLSTDAFPQGINVFMGTIASGEKVVGSTASALYKHLKLHSSHALAVEMEGFGFLEACRAYPLIKSLVVRGISDLVNDKKQSDDAGSQPYAANNAVEFLFGIIDQLKLEQNSTRFSKKDMLLEILPKLYPLGLRENSIWTRAGGDLSLVNLTSNGRSQWFEAIDFIQKGGGGDIDFQSLIREIKTDFPKNESINRL